MSDTLQTDIDWVLDYQLLISRFTQTNFQILELGCGRGRDTQNLIRMGNVIATDINEESLQSCARSNPSASVVCMDLAKTFPFIDNAFSVIVASLSIHYFSWETTLAVQEEIMRCVEPSGIAIIRFNSTNDTNYGANSTDLIEPNYYRVNGQPKRFFDQLTIQRLFSKNWHIRDLEETTIDRYTKTKSIWTVILRPAVKETGDA